MSVNISARQVEQLDLGRDVERALAASSLPPTSLALEITETVLMETNVAATQSLEDLQSLGVEIHLDDFGAGYSSFAYLHRLPIDLLKIDRSFVAGLGAPGERFEIVETMMTMARSMGISVIAEGIESAQQVERLRKVGCTYGQGYHFARPADAESTGALIARCRAPGRSDGERVGTRPIKGLLRLVS